MARVLQRVLLAATLFAAGGAAAEGDDSPATEVPARRSGPAAVFAPDEALDAVAEATIADDGTMTIRCIRRTASPSDGEPPAR